MKKHRLFVSISKEENWINQIQAQGYRLIRVHPYTAGYSFERVQQEADIPIVRLDYRQFTSTQDYLEYLSLFAECGWKLIPGSNRNSFQYFAHTAYSEDTELFSDDESRQALYQRVRKQALLFFSISMVQSIIFFQVNHNHFQNFWNLKELYLTPGLWEKSGSNFWLAFLFETPFAFLRTIFPAFILLGSLGSSLFCLYIAYKNRSQHHP